MTDALYQRDSYLREFDAVVTAVVPGSDGHAVTLDRTAFYPGGGGQPNDEGTLAVAGFELRVVGVRRQDGEVWHEVEGGGAPEVGAAVRGTLDWERRFALMRTHTALHILCGVMYRDHGALVTGGNMTPLGARMDFEIEGIGDSFAEFAQQVEARANLEIAAARPISVGFLSRAEADARPELIRTKVNLLPPGITEVRTVDIEGLDLQADGGTHVTNTSEVGRIRIVGHESKGRINKRLRIAVEDA